jgi:hypothetical protein
VFAGHWLAALAVFVLAVVLRTIVNFANMATEDGTAVFGVIVATVTGATIGLGYRAYRVGVDLGRKPVFYGHVVVTVVSAGLLLLAFVIWGFSWTRVIFSLLTLMAGAISWNLHRIDALRADPRDKGEDDKGWGAILGLPGTRVGKVSHGDYAVTATLHHGPGETAKQVAGKLDALESAANAVSGRGMVVPGERAGSSEVTLVLEDPMKLWRPLPGLSHPGGSFADPIRISYYAHTGKWEEYWFPHGRMPNGEIRSFSHRGRMGTTGSGKSGDLKNEAAEVASRRDVVILWADAVKGLQGAGGLIEFFTSFADTEVKAKLLFRAVKELTKYRADAMGAAGFTDWTPEVYAQLGFPAVYYVIDEGDELIQTSEVFKWLATKVRSVGIYLALTLPRADHQSMPPTSRYSIGAWKCFGTGDDYSESFALSEETLAAGANTTSLKARIPGAHYHDSSPGIAPQMYPIMLRSGESSHEQLTEWVRTARAGFTAATFTAKEVEILNQNGAYTACLPSNRRTGTALAVPAPATNDDGGDDMRMNANEDEADRRPPSEHAEPGDDEEYAKIDPRMPVTTPPGSDLDLEDDKPRPRDYATMAAEFERVIREMATEGLTEFTTGDLYRRASACWSESYVSKRLRRALEDEAIRPPGIMLERHEDGKAGHYSLMFDPSTMVGAGQP